MLGWECRISDWWSTRDGECITERICTAECVCVLHREYAQQNVFITESIHAQSNVCITERVCTAGCALHSRMCTACEAHFSFSFFFDVHRVSKLVEAFPLHFFLLLLPRPFLPPLRNDDLDRVRWHTPEKCECDQRMFVLRAETGWSVLFTEKSLCRENRIVILGASAPSVCVLVLRVPLVCFFVWRVLYASSKRGVPQRGSMRCVILKASLMHTHKHIHTHTHTHTTTHCHLLFASQSPFTSGFSPCICLLVPPPVRPLCLPPVRLLCAS